MKIFFFDTCPDGTVGGSHACMYNLIRNIDPSEMNFTAGFYADNIYAQRYRDLGINVEIVPFTKPLKSRNIVLRKGLNWYRLEYKRGKYLEDYFQRNRFNLVVINNSIYSGLLFVRISKKMDIPIIVYERGFADYTKKQIKATADIQASIPVSDAVHQNLLRYNFRTKIIERIYDGIDPSRFVLQRNPAAIKADLNIPPNSRIIGIIGNVKPWKGQQYFIDAFLQLAKKNDDLYGLVIGGWAEEDREFQAGLKETVTKAHLGNRLMFLGYRTDVPELLSIFDVFVHASRRAEPFGMVILEAMAAKKPIIATNLGGPIEILNKGECGILVPPKDGKAIGEASVKYLNKPDFRQEMADRAYERLLRNYHISQTVEKTVRLFKRIYDSRNRTTVARASGRKKILRDSVNHPN